MIIYPEVYGCPIVNNLGKNCGGRLAFLRDHSKFFACGFRFLQLSSNWILVRHRLAPITHHEVSPVQFWWPRGTYGDRKKPGERRVRLLFFVDGCSQNRRPLRIIKFLGVKDLARVVFHCIDSAGFPLSPPVFFGLKHRRKNSALLRRSRWRVHWRARLSRRSLV